MQKWTNEIVYVIAWTAIMYIVRILPFQHEYYAFNVALALLVSVVDKIIVYMTKGYKVHAHNNIETYENNLMENCWYISITISNHIMKYELTFINVRIYGSSITER